VAAQLVGRDDDSAVVCERAYRECLRLGDDASAARYAFWLGFGLMNRGEFACAGGWCGPARRLLDDGQHDCVERGYLLMPDGVQSFLEGDAAAAHATFCQAALIGERFRDDFAEKGQYVMMRDNGALRPATPAELGLA
jgi:hypothetical protein